MLESLTLKWSWSNKKWHDSIKCVWFPYVHFYYPYVRRSKYIIQPSKAEAALSLSHLFNRPGSQPWSLLSCFCIKYFTSVHFISIILGNPNILSSHQKPEAVSVTTPVYSNPLSPALSLSNNFQQIQTMCSKS